MGQKKKFFFNQRGWEVTDPKPLLLLYYNIVKPSYFSEICAVFKIQWKNFEFKSQRSWNGSSE